MDCFLVPKDEHKNNKIEPVKTQMSLEKKRVLWRGKGPNLMFVDSEYLLFTLRLLG